MSINFKKKKHYYGTIPKNMMTIKFIKKSLKEVIDYCDYSDNVTVDELENEFKVKAIYHLERCSNVFRRGLELSTEDTLLCDVIQDESISITVKNDIISVFTPLTFNRKKHEYLAIVTRVAIAFDKFENANPGINLTNIYKRRDATCNVFQIRMVHKFKSYLKDNNNENGAIVNEILGNRLLISDNPQIMVTYTDMCVEVPEDYPVGMLHLVIPTEKLNLYLDDIFLKKDFFKFM